MHEIDTYIAITLSVNQTVLKKKQVEYCSSTNEQTMQNTPKQISRTQITKIQPNGELKPSSFVIANYSQQQKDLEKEVGSSTNGGVLQLGGPLNIGEVSVAGFVETSGQPPQILVPFLVQFFYCNQWPVTILRTKFDING